PHDGDVLTLVDVDRKAAQRVDLFRAHDIRFPEILRRDQSHGHSLYLRSPQVLCSFNRWIRERTIAGVSGGNSASQSLTSTGTTTGPAFRDLRRCSLIAVDSSLDGANPVPARITQRVASATLAFIAGVHTSATASRSTSGTNLTSSRTLSSAFLNSPRLGLELTARSKPGIGL